ncbi:MAG TPA: hypothetical protein VLN74_12950, partial [Ilumatobacteraceae bacterium]|nr:hypothetical protein [Ilumatobacteraceae bacterium]
MVPVTTSIAPTTTATPSTTAAPPATTTATTTTTASTTTLPVHLDVFAPDCVVRVEGESSLEDVATATGNLDVAALWLENDQIDAVISGDLVDICAGNALDDITGAPRPLIDDATRASAIAANVERQQVKLN